MSEVSVSITTHFCHSFVILMSAYRNCCFTLNNPNVEPQAFIEELVAHLPLKAVVFQTERGDQEDTPHYQGYLELTKRVVHNTLHVALHNAHIEPRRGTQAQAIAYCQKAETRVAGPFTWGTFGRQGARSDLSLAVDTLRTGGITAVAREHPNEYIKFGNGLSRLDVRLHKHDQRGPVSVTLIYGPAGIGKTRLCYEGEPELVPIPDSLSWFDNYEGEQAVLFDDFDGAMSKCPLKWLLQLLDRYPLMVPIKGSFTLARWSRVYITTNIHPRKWYDWSEREQQWPALIRRVARVISFGNDPDFPLVMDRTHERWQRWWAGPRDAVPRVLGPMDDYVEQDKSDDKFDFIF